MLLPSVKTVRPKLLYMLCAPFFTQAVNELVATASRSTRTFALRNSGTCHAKLNLHSDSFLFRFAYIYFKPPLILWTPRSALGFPPEFLLGPAAAGQVITAPTLVMPHHEGEVLCLLSNLGQTFAVQHAFGTHSILLAALQFLLQSAALF